MRKTRYQVKEIVKEYIRVLKSLGIGVKQVILYGSFAKGNPKRDSDIDLIVVSSDFRKLNLRERLEILGIAAARIMKPIEAKGYTPQEIKMPSEDSFLKEILELGINI
jgi:predicted nucleotidyltransferase